MNFQLLQDNLTNPALLFFLLGIVAMLLKSDLEIPANSSKFISLYLLFSIGFKGGQELSNEIFDSEVLTSIGIGITLSFLIPIYCFFILKQKLTIYDSAAVAASYGSVSAVTFVTATSFLESFGLNLQGHMVAVMAFMESPAIIVSLILMSYYSSNQQKDGNNKWLTIRHSLTNGSVILIIGSMLIGFFASSKQAEGIKPFTNDIFKGFLAIFLLDMGVISGKNLKSLFSYGWFPLLFAVLIPLINGSFVAYFSRFLIEQPSNRFMLSILAASASYIAVPAAMKISNPRANPGLYLPMPLALTFPVNITLGFPLFFWIIQR